jgi:hypothetical protein
MTPAAFGYVAGLYESCIDRSLDVDAIRLHLAARGIVRSPAQVVNDLDNVYCFHEYAASHPAPAEQTLAQIDKQFD